MAAFSFDDGIATLGFSTICALRMRVSISAIGSLMLMDQTPGGACAATALVGSRAYQLALTTPGMSPLNASSRILLRDRPNFLKLPRGRPVMPQRLRCRVGLALRGSFCSSRRDA